VHKIQPRQLEKVHIAEALLDHRRLPYYARPPRPNWKWPLLFSGHTKHHLGRVAAHFQELGSISSPWWRALYGPPALFGLDEHKWLRGGRSTHIQGSGAMPGLSGTLTHNASWGGGCPPRARPTAHVIGLLRDTGRSKQTWDLSTGAGSGEPD